jgi:hypothetical protein
MPHLAFEGSCHTALASSFAVLTAGALEDVRATGTVSRRLQNASTTEDDSGGLLWTSVETGSSYKRKYLEGLAPEVSHHQHIGETEPLEFNSRRLHHFVRISQGIRAFRAWFPPPPSFLH